MKQPDRGALDRYLSLSLALWGAATAAFGLANGLLLALRGSAVFEELVQVGPVSGLKLTYSALALVWFSCGLTLALFRSPGYRARHGLVTIVCLLTLLLYANVLRERMEYPDSGDYMRAALDLAEGRPLHERYIYPPLWAAALELLVPLGRGGLRTAMWTLNLLAVSAFAGLLSLALARYGFERRLAAVMAFGFVAINVPVLRTLVYGQVNLHVANLILLALLLFPRLPVASALALALAVHLKSSPVVLALPFLLERSWRWTAAFAFWLAAIAGTIYAVHGAQPFLDFLRNASGVYAWSDVSFRDNSIESFFRSTAARLGGPFTALDNPVPRSLAKATVLLLALAVAGAAAWRKPFAPGPAPGSLVENTLPALSVLMVLASPLVWEHHPVFVALPFLVITKRLQTPHEWAVFGLAYAVVFLLPTFDFYPWSFGRLAGLLTILALLYGTSRRGEDGELFRLALGRIARAANR